MRRASTPAGRHGDLAGVRFCIGDKLWHGSDRDRRMDFHHERGAHNSGNWGNVADEIEVELVVKRGVDGIGRAYQQQGVAVWRGLCDEFSRKIAPRSWAVLYHE